MQKKRPNKAGIGHLKNLSSHDN